jgi:hypothetical protein
MKLLITVYILVAVVMIAWAFFHLANVYVSLKYEVQEPIAMGKQSIDLLREKHRYLTDLIFWLWIFIITQVINIAISIFMLIKRK